MENFILDYLETDKIPDVRELTVINGISFPSDEELIMLILGKGTKNNPIREMAGQVIQAINSNDPEDLIESLKRIKGMGETRALIVAAALELGRRRSGFLRSVIEKPEDIIPFVKHYCLMPTEHFIIATVNGAKEIMSTHVISVGTTNRTLIHPREVFCEAIKEHASGIICCHNHPCGQCKPSAADIESTKTLVKASKILGITLMDHIILTRGEYFSFMEHGMMSDECEQYA